MTMTRRWKAVLLGLTVLICGACGGEDREASEDGAGAPRPDPATTVQLLFTYGSEKQAWIDDVTAAFNASGARTSNGKQIQVEAVAQGSGEAIDDLLAGARQAHLTSPASEAFIRLGNARSRARTGKDLVGETRNLVLSPVVIAMWRPMAEALGWPQKPVGWSDILALARDPAGWSAHGHPEWGAFKFGHTHPEYSNSGLISMLAEVYAANGKVAGLTLEDVRRPETAAFVSGIESSVVHYGSSTGFFGKRLFTDGPRYLSAAVLYESSVIDSTSPEYRLQFPVVALYPKEGTFWSDHPVGIVDREWVTPEHREAAKIYIDYLLARPQQEKALQYGFRPSDVNIPLAAPFDATHGVDPKEPQTTLEVPPVEVIDAALGLFHEAKKRSDVTLVLDVSGSMQDDGKIDAARVGAEQLLTLLDDRDSFSLLAFNDDPRWILQDQPLAQGRAGAIESVRGLIADGGTALYDAIGQAYDDLLQRRDRGRIAAIVVLSDGEDRDSRTKLDELLSKISAGSEDRGIRVFTIAYGKDAKQDILKTIAEATRARSYEGNPANIRTVFREISTFF
ncbi:MAG TPA: VWA domain-containing protein [Thermoanaerobaculia bacterium]|jgi:Ca-activated chloride channel family protein|nr:VWA domain-containing protein [Thermoanaerobaculia bacterium]